MLPFALQFFKNEIPPDMTMMAENFERNQKE